MTEPPPRAFGAGMQVRARAGSRLHVLGQRLRRCTACAGEFAAHGHRPRPVARLSASARIAVCAQAPGIRVHETGLSFHDRSGDRLRAWMDVPAETFYDARRIAIVPMASCFPGRDARGGDLPPPARCAALWRAEIFARMPQIELLLLVGLHAQRWHLGARSHATLGANMDAWRGHLRDGLLPLPHPSWRNNRWLAERPWFARELLPALRRRVRALL